MARAAFDSSVAMAWNIFDFAHIAKSDFKKDCSAEAIQTFCGPTQRCRLIERTNQQKETKIE